MKVEFLIVSSVFFIGSVTAMSAADFQKRRNDIIEDESKQFLGGSLTLNSKEKLANEILMDAKHREYDRSQTNLNFPPAVHYFQARSSMLESEVFKFICQMPKGGILHIHDSTITPLEFLIANASYRENLYICSSSSSGPLNFIFAPSTPAHPVECKWELVSERRSREGAAEFDAFLLSRFSLYSDNPAETYPNSNVVWRAFEDALISISGILNYAPVFRDYFYEGLQSIYDDNVQYVEIRTLLPQVYELNGTVLDEFQVTALYSEIFEKFGRDYPDFSGAKIIYAPHRRANAAEITGYISLVSELKRQFPNVVAGFDLVGQEDLGPALHSFINELISGLDNADLKYFFHAGETDWEGTSVDENLIDAILLNTTRIGHGFAIAKHPVVMEMARAKQVPIEVCPISNQILGLVADLRNHPAAALFTNGFPLVISNDDPPVWQAVGLSSDFYMAFMGMAGRRADLRTLKQLALNSITFSAMDTNEKTAAFNEWQRRWDLFIDGFYEYYQTSNNLS